MSRQIYIFPHSDIEFKNDGEFDWYIEEGIVKENWRYRHTQARNATKGSIIVLAYNNHLRGEFEADFFENPMPEESKEFEEIYGKPPRRVYLIKKGSAKRYKQPVPYAELKIQLSSFKGKRTAARIRFAPKLNEDEYMKILRKTRK